MLQSYGGEIPKEHLGWAQSLPLIHTDEHRIFVHAGIRDGAYLEDQTPEDLLWTRVSPDYSGEYWGKHLSMVTHRQLPTRKRSATGRTLIAHVSSVEDYPAQSSMIAHPVDRSNSLR
jgi:serine/threonine protein phosphatase 1